MIELIGKPISLAPIYRAVTASKWVFLLVEDMKQPKRKRSVIAVTAAIMARRKDATNRKA